MTGGSSGGSSARVPDLPGRVLVVGCGALGGLLLARLTEAGVDAWGLARSERLASLATEGVVLQGPDAPRCVPVRASAQVTGPVDVVVLATKTDQLEEAVLRLLPRVGRAPLVSLQNGPAAARQLRTLVPARRVVAGVAMFAATFTPPNRVRSTLEGALLLERHRGSGAQRARAAATLLGAAVPVVREPAIEGAQNLKVLLNLTHAIPALVGASHRRAFSDPRLALLAMRLRREGHRVLSRAGAPLGDLPGYPLEVLERSLRVSLTRAALEFSLAVRRLPAAFVSSQEQSLARGVPGEVDQINGEVLALARRQGLRAPFNEALVGLVHNAARTGRTLSCRALLRAVAPHAR